MQNNGLTALFPSYILCKWYHVVLLHLKASAHLIAEQQLYLQNIYLFETETVATKVFGNLYVFEVFISFPPSLS